MQIKIQRIPIQFRFFTDSDSDLSDSEKSKTMKEINKTMHLLAMNSRIFCWKFQNQITDKSHFKEERD